MSIMSTNYPTLVHFRHFRSLLTNLTLVSCLLSPVFCILSTIILYSRLHTFMQNKPNFPHFSPEKTDFKKNKANSNPIQSQFNPIRTQLKPIQNQFKPNNQLSFIDNHLEGKSNFTTLKSVVCLNFWEILSNMCKDQLITMSIIRGRNLLCTL
jgi:hypothetical protein